MLPMRARTMMVVLWLTTILPMAVAAQVSSGKILGAVQDESAGVLPGVSIVLRNVDTGVTRETVSNERGRYEVAGLQPGRYQAEAELSGFRRYTQGPIVVRVNEESLVNVVLSVGNMTETVNVTAEGLIVQTTTFSTSWRCPPASHPSQALSGRT